MGVDIDEAGGHHIPRRVDLFDAAPCDLAEAYDEIAKSGAKFGLVKEEDANLEDYITRKALDGLFVGIADEEKKIRENPKAAASSIVKKVFGALVK
jgi:hypothetical protein